MPDLFVPDGSDPDAALERTTDLGIVAHPDDIELMMPAPVIACAEREDRWFTGVVCADGATPTVTAATRHAEQREAASIGGYSAIVQLGHPSAAIYGAETRSDVVHEIVDILLRARPINVYTHDLADRHRTHVAVGLATIEAIRRMDPQIRPGRVVGCEGWRGLAWMLDQEKIRMPVNTSDDLALRLTRAHVSQLSAKAYDSAFQGRRRANATLHEIRNADTDDEVMVAMELTPLVRNDDLDPAEFVAAAVDRFRGEVLSNLAQAGGSPGQLPCP